MTPPTEPQETPQFSRELGAVDTVYMFHAQSALGALLQIFNGNDPEIVFNAALTLRLELGTQVYDLLNEAIERGGKGNAITLLQYRAALAALGMEDRLLELVGEEPDVDNHLPTTEGS